ncbi:DNA polymerase III subunit epsilon [Candidatus Comchoanobacter bicostacola]|uniref:DNA polymerase III subunit epsilon n=1 Tax=Candidatus Comchoanobacter bicostacola TaxID=2919598 RepID=A0ABY5DK06_9GAMM|nr:DNA polymerase III subunit epsilon [Candidatus Comchoanobacter bicostacola]UTC24317.1 DNA polymerase III subunit epsilon [Candidatus Comchoanobacter bicostacola]
MSRFIFADTETTGFDPKSERMLELALIEVVDRQQTGRVLHLYINPEQEVSAGAYRVHGISWNDVKDKPVFKSVAQEVIDFMQGGIFLAHNAPFDVGFFNMEFKRAGVDFMIGRDVDVVDTLAIAKKMYPGQRNSLDALCTRLSIDRSHRKLHGALLDTELLVQVYLMMTSKQGRFNMKLNKAVSQSSTAAQLPCLQVALSDEDKAAHEAYLETIG